MIFEDFNIDQTLFERPKDIITDELESLVSNDNHAVKLKKFFDLNQEERRLQAITLHVLNNILKGDAKILQGVFEECLEYLHLRKNDELSLKSLINVVIGYKNDWKVKDNLKNVFEQSLDQLKILLGCSGETLHLIFDLLSGSPF